MRSFNPLRRLFIVFACSAPLGAIAADSTSPTPSTGLFQVLMGLFVVLGLMIAAAWFLKRFGPKQFGNRAAIRVVGGVSLGGRERIVVVEMGDQWIVASGLQAGDVIIVEGLQKIRPGAVVKPADFLKA